MESSRTRVEILKPIFLTAGIPLVFSIAGFVFSRIQTRNIRISKSLPSDPKYNEDILSTHEYCLEEKKKDEEIESLGRQICFLQEKELKIENHFLLYHKLKEKELALIEFNNKLLLEMARIDFLSSELSSIEEDNKRFDKMVAEFVQVLDELMALKSENEKLKEFEGVIKKQSLKMEENEAELSRNRQEFERMADVIKELEDNNIQLQIVNEKSHEEKTELMEKLDSAEKSAVLKSEAEELMIENYSNLLKDLEQFQKEREVEVNELIYLRWCNACLKHELKRSDQEKQEENLEGKKNEAELELDLEEHGVFGHEVGLTDNGIGQGQSCLAIRSGRRARRKKLIQKLKKWIEGNRKGKLDETEEKHIPSRVSCSSA